MKQAPKAWYEKLYAALHSLGFTGSQNDHSLFVKKDPSLVFVLVYVDDIIVTGPPSQTCQTMISQLSTLFPIKDLGPLHYFLGLEVKRSSKGLVISQTKYILDLLKRAKMDGAQPCVTPLSTSKLDHLSPLLSNPAEYRSIVVGYNTSHGLDLTCLLQLILFANSCIIQGNPTFKQSKGFSAISKGLWILDFGFQSVQLY